MPSQGFDHYMTEGAKFQGVSYGHEKAGNRVGRHLWQEQAALNKTPAINLQEPELGLRPWAVDWLVAHQSPLDYFFSHRGTFQFVFACFECK
jgi:hypothetical protein